MPTLDWLNRAEALTIASQVPYRVLDHVETVGDPDSGNLLIQGDNLDALKALLPVYRGRVKCIFIDPPYNTKSAFEHYDDNLEHSRWLSMIYPRLVLLRELLAENGSIWAAVDDNEGHYLKVVMDEVFGRKNFLTTFIWQKSYGGGAKAKYFVGLHEYVHCYAKNIELLPDFFWPPEKEAVSKYYKLKDEKFTTRGPYRLQPLATTSNDERPNLRYPILADSGAEIWPTKQWQWSRERVAEARSNGEIVISEKNGRFSVSYKQYLLSSEGEERRTKPKTIIGGHFTQHGTYESVELFGQDAKFAFPKPEGLLQKILEAATAHGDIVLDSFLGSGTTAAVCQKMGRRWIGVEMGEHAQTHCLLRLRRVVDGEQGGISQQVGWQGGGGFQFVRLGAPIFDESGAINANIRFGTLAQFIWLQETQSAAAKKFRSPWLGTHEGTAYYLLYNGILGDKRPDGGNVLTGAVLSHLLENHPHDGPKVIYGEASRLGPARLAAANVVFKQIPYDVKAR